MNMVYPWLNRIALFFRFAYSLLDSENFLLSMLNFN